MKIYIDRIPETGLKLNEDLQPAVLDLERGDIRFSEPINVSGEITKGIGNLSAQIKITTTSHVNCSRCLEEFLVPLNKEVNLNIPIQDEEEIDLTDSLREEIILGYPLKPLCRENCSGLCPTCGRNLNEGSCGCKPKGENNGSSKKKAL